MTKNLAYLIFASLTFLSCLLQANQAIAQGVGGRDYYWCSGSPSDSGQYADSEKAMALVCMKNQDQWPDAWSVISLTCGGNWQYYPQYGTDEDDGACQIKVGGPDPRSGEYQEREYGTYLTRCSFSPWRVWMGSQCWSVLPKVKDKDRTCGLVDPIYPLTGANVHPQSLGFSLAGTTLNVVYDQRNLLLNSTNGMGHQIGGTSEFGQYWHGSFSRLLVAQTFPDQSTVVNIALERGDGRWETFQPNADRSLFISTVELLDTIQPLTSGWRRIDGRSLFEEIYDASGKLLQTNYADGRALTYAYPNGLLQSMTDQTGRTITFSFGPTSGKIETISSLDGSQTSLSYNSSGDLASVTWPDANAAKFLYEQPNSPSALTGVVDEAHSIADGVQFQKFGYDSSSRVTSAENAGGVDRYSIAYSQAPAWQSYDAYDTLNRVVWRTISWQPPVAPVLTLPNGQQSTLTAVDVLGSPAQAAQTQVSGAGCSAATSAQTFDDGAGNPTSQDDFNGNRVCFAYDTTRNLRTVTLEGLQGGTSGKACPASLASYVPSASNAAYPERKTMTAWHPDWALKAQEAEPKKITTWVYNGQPDPIGGGTAACVTPATALPDGKPLAVLCARYEQATTDATGAFGMSATVTGAARKWSYTYNQYGQVLSETTPKQSATDALSHTTTYAYYADTSLSGNVGHTLGDLQVVTNPKGQQTTYTSYDGAGRLLSSTDANGVVSNQTYWPRGWLHTQMVTPVSGTALTTTYNYWPTGLLKTVTMPDASTLNYVYDDAHRLTDVTDAAGNKIHYVLDNMGNRTGEQVIDASGNLASTVSRVFDALNRVQSQTGQAH